jgi:hypothetical protein
LIYFGNEASSSEQIPEVVLVYMIVNLGGFQNVAEFLEKLIHFQVLKEDIILNVLLLIY